MRYINRKNDDMNSTFLRWNEGPFTNYSIAKLCSCSTSDELLWGETGIMQCSAFTHSEETGHSCRISPILLKRLIWFWCHFQVQLIPQTFKSRVPSPLFFTPWRPHNEPLAKELEKDEFLLQFYNPCSGLTMPKEFNQLGFKSWNNGRNICCTQTSCRWPTMATFLIAYHHPEHPEDLDQGQMDQWWGEETFS